MTRATPWWDRDRYADRYPFLMARNRVTGALRAWFQAGGFVEVETPALQVSPGNETHLHAVPATLIAPDGAPVARYLRTSPEFALKKLLAAGETRLVDFARVFRNRELGPLHAPEFTIVEWYRAGAVYQAAMADCVAVLHEAALAAGTAAMTWRGREADPYAEPVRMTVCDAFAAHAGVDLAGSLDDRGRLVEEARRVGIRVAADDTWSDVFSRVLVEKVEPRLGVGRPAILYEYPACEAALARTKPDDPRLAERFELYVCGVELANGFAELTDATEQRRRFERAMDDQQRIYGERYPLDEDFLAALGAMPEASGVALGLDRLVMLATGATDITQVQWAPVDSGGES